MIITYKKACLVLNVSSDFFRRNIERFEFAKFRVYKDIFFTKKSKYGIPIKIKKTVKALKFNKTFLKKWTEYIKNRNYIRRKEIK